MLESDQKIKFCPVYASHIRLHIIIHHPFSASGTHRWGRKASWSDYYVSEEARAEPQRSGWKLSALFTLALNHNPSLHPGKLHCTNHSLDNCKEITQNSFREKNRDHMPIKQYSLSEIFLLNHIEYNYMFLGL